MANFRFPNSSSAFFVDPDQFFWEMPRDSSQRSQRQNAEAARTEEIKKSILKDYLLRSYKSENRKLEAANLQLRQNPVQHGFLPRISKLISVVDKTGETFCPTITTVSKTIWKTIKLVGSSLPTIFCIYAIGEAATTAIHMTDIAVKTANAGVKILGGLAIGAAAIKGVQFVVTEGKDACCAQIKTKANEWIFTSPLTEKAPKEKKHNTADAGAPKTKPTAAKQATADPELPPEFLQQLFSGRPVRVVGR